MIMAAPMLTVLVAASDDPIALAETLGALVPGAVDGLVKRVAVVTPGPAGAEIGELIDASGADHLVAEGDAAALWRAGLRQARPGWRLCLIAGAVPSRDWTEAVARHLARGDAGAAVFGIEGGPMRRAMAGLARLAGRIDPLTGFLTRASDLAAGGRLHLLPARISDRRAG
jgi:hypothetical protein